LVVRNLTKNIILARRAIIADTFLSRMKGLLGKPPLKEDEALIITRCRSIHMFFMRYAIDVIFVGRENHVVGLVENIGPFRLSPVFWKAELAVELMAGTISATKTSDGDTLELHA
jgi:uncharacterized membrane protein (UPF0127 family)